MGQDEQGAKKKGGRPRKHPVGTRVPTLAFRVRADLRDRLEASAAEAQRSISEEIERRVEDSLNREQHTGRDARSMGDLVAITLHTIEQRFGRTWHSDKAAASYCFDRLKDALAKAMVVDVEMPGNKLQQAAEPDVTAARALAAHDNRAATAAAPTLSDEARAPWDLDVRPATPDELAAMVPARGQLPPSIGDQAMFDDAVSELPLVKAERAAEARRREKAPLDVGAGSPETVRKPKISGFKLHLKGGKITKTSVAVDE